MLLPGFYCLIVRILSLLNITPGKKPVVILIPSFCKKEFVSLGWTILKLCHTASFFSRSLCVFDPKYETHHTLWIVRHLSRLSSFRVGYRVYVSNEMATVLVRLVHFHHGSFVNERLFFCRQLLRLAGFKRYYRRRYQQQNSQLCFASFQKGVSHEESSAEVLNFFQIIFARFEALRT